MTDPVNFFQRISAINVFEHVKKKGQFSYLSWPYAVAQLRPTDPAAFWEVRRFGGLPYLATDAVVFVEVAVTVQGVTLSRIHPVLDARNRPLIAPTSFDINTSIQRCLVKAIALHGLGLYIFAGEDLPANVAAGAAANDEGRAGASGNSGRLYHEGPADGRLLRCSTGTRSAVEMRLRTVVRLRARRSSAWRSTRVSMAQA